MIPQVLSYTKLIEFENKITLKSERTKGNKINHTNPQKGY